MLKFAANLTTLFTEMPMQDRIQAAADAGFDGIEIQFPYDSPAPEIRKAMARAALPLVLINAPPPNYTGGTAGFAAMPGGSDRFRHDFRRAMRYADSLKAQTVHVMSGAAYGDEARDTLVENLKWACDFAPQQRITIEPMNAQDLPGYFMCDFDLAAEVHGQVGAQNLFLQFDTYHAHRITGDVAGAWRRYGAMVGHVQIAGADQAEPEDGRIDFSGFYATLAQDGYAGWIAADYRPRKLTRQGLDWLAAARRAGEGLRRPA